MHERININAARSTMNVLLAAAHPHHSHHLPSIHRATGVRPVAAYAPTSLPPELSRLLSTDLSNRSALLKGHERCVGTHVSMHCADHTVAARLVVHAERKTCGGSAARSTDSAG